MRRVNAGLTTLAGMLATTLLIGTLSPVVGQARINKCNIDGKLVYTNHDCPGVSIKSSPVAPGSKSGGDRSVERYQSSEWLRDRTGYYQAVRLSTKYGAPVLVYGYTDWCGYCRKLERKLLQNAEVEQLLSRFIKVKVNPEHSAADKRLFNLWGGRGYPALFIQDVSASTPTRIRGPFRKKNGRWELMSSIEFVALLQSRLR